MNIVFLTADEPLYLPAFFAQILAERAHDTRAVFTVPPRYGKGSSLQMARKYVAAFGAWNFAKLAQRTLTTKVLDLCGMGRSRRRYYSVASVAAAFGVPCEHVAEVNDEAFLAKLRGLQTDLIASVSCPQVFRKPLIDLPALGCLNVHGAPLPKYRGIAPSFWMMARGEARAGVTVFLVNEDLDAGDVIEVVEFDIDPHESLEQFIIRSKRIACQALLRGIQKIEQGNFRRTPLDKEKGSYFGFPTRAAYREFRRRGRRLW